MTLTPSDFPEVAMPFMHDNHLEEVDLLNAIYALIEQVEAGGEAPELAARVDTLLSHTIAHFASENEKMRESRFPPYPVHKREHDRFLEEFTRVVETWKKTGDLAPLAKYLRETIPAWMKHHISTMDYVTANFLAMHERTGGKG
jgi:hemerythrin